MADLLTHVLVPYILMTVFGWIREIPRELIPVTMGGAAIPDLVKVSILVDPGRLSELLGVPFSYSSISSLAGVLLVAGVIALLFDNESRKTVYGMLVFGGSTALVLDALRTFADGSAGFWLYPLWVRSPTPNLYVTSDPRVVIVAICVSLVVATIDRRRRRTVDPTSRES
jgi:hypothetical protein